MKKSILFATLLCSLAGFGQKAAAPAPFVLGTIETVQSRELNEKRTLNIYLPEGYNEKDSLRYPVVYLLDGSADEDFVHIVGLYQFNAFSWVARVPPSIVVGIATVDRRRDFTFPTTIAEDRSRYPTTGRSDRFMAFVRNELQPFIEKKFKTSRSKTLIGESLGGLFAVEVLYKNPGLFNKYFIVSPSLWWDNGTLLDKKFDRLQAFSGDSLQVYIGVGKEGLTPTQAPRVMEVDANLLADKLVALRNKNVHVYFDYLPRENHATIMHQAVMDALQVFGR